MDQLTKKQKRNLNYLAEDIQVFITTQAKPGKKLKCTNGKSFDKNIIVETNQFDYLMKTIQSNLGLLDLEFELIENDYSDMDLMLINKKSLVLKLNRKGILANKKLKLPIHYEFVFDDTKQRTYFCCK